METNNMAITFDLGHATSKYAKLQHPEWGYKALQHKGFIFTAGFVQLWVSHQDTAMDGKIQAAGLGSLNLGVSVSTLGKSCHNQSVVGADVSNIMHWFQYLAALTVIDAPVKQSIVQKAVEQAELINSGFQKAAKATNFMAQALNSDSLMASMDLTELEAKILAPNLGDGLGEAYIPKHGIKKVAKNPAPKGGNVSKPIDFEMLKEAMLVDPAAGTGQSGSQIITLDSLGGIQGVMTGGFTTPAESDEQEPSLALTASNVTAFTKMLQTSGTIPLIDAVTLLQPVKGTDLSSRYYVVALAGAAKVAMRVVSHQDRFILSTRVEGATPAQIKHLLKMGLNPNKNQTYCSAHFNIQKEPEAVLYSTMAGAILSMNLPLKSMLLNLQDLPVENGTP